MRSAMLCVAAASLLISGCSPDPAEAMAEVRRLYTVTVAYEPGGGAATGAAVDVRFVGGEGVEVEELLTGAEVRVNGQPIPRYTGDTSFGDRQVVQFGDPLEQALAPAAKYVFEVSVPGLSPIVVETTPTTTATFGTRAVTAPFGAPIQVAWSAAVGADEGHDWLGVELQDGSIGGDVITDASEVAISAEELASFHGWPDAPSAEPLAGSLTLIRVKSSGADLDQVFSMSRLDRVPLTITP